MFSAIRSYSRVLFVCAAVVSLSGCIESDAAKPFTKLVSPVRSGYAQYCQSGMSVAYVCYMAKVTAAPNAPTRVELKEEGASTSQFFWFQATPLEGGRFLLQNIGSGPNLPKPPYQGTYVYATLLQDELNGVVPACDEARLKAAFTAIDKPVTANCNKGLLGSTAKLPPDFPEEQLKKLIQGYADLPHTRAAAAKVKIAPVSDEIGEYFWNAKKPEGK